MAYRFSGHETFPCRYAWLPKAFAAISADPEMFGDEEVAMIRLGVGKNMVRSIRFWTQAAGISIPRQAGGYEITPFGRAVFGRKGHDPFLEDARTLWLIHWNLSSQTTDPLFAWDYLLNFWQEPELSRSSVLRAFRKEAEKQERPLSDVTLEQHFDTFLHSYVPTRSRKGDIQEDNLDCPLVELELIQQVGDRRIDQSGRREPIYAFRRDEKPGVTPEVFIYCLDEYWRNRRPTEKTLTFRDVAFGHGSPGQVFKLSEWDVRRRLEAIAVESDGLFHYRESAALQQLFREERNAQNSLGAIYEVAATC
ncbi:MAG TPA: DUF4007 family protein [Candidatus Anammoximicrobium sp.]|nr:DUF4007 family protein [Candidatus Anammoximicrobium sp.]